MIDVSSFITNDRYTLYDVVIMQSKKNPSLWFAKKKYVSLKEIEDQRFHSLNEEIIDGKPITTGYFYIYDNNVDAIEDFVNLTPNQKYELTIIRDDKGNKIVEKGVKVSSRKEIVCLNVSPIRKTKEAKKDYFFLTVSIKESDLDNAKNKTEIIEGFRHKGLNFQTEPHNGFYQFNALVFPTPKQIPTINSYVGKTLHLEYFVKEKEDQFRIERVGRAVLEFDPLKVKGMVTDVDGDMVEITVFTNWDKLNDDGLRNIIHFTSKEREILKEPTPEGNTIKLTYKVKAKTGFKGEVGDDVVFELSEGNVKKILKTKIEYDFNQVSDEVVKPTQKKIDTTTETETVSKDESLPF